MGKLIYIPKNIDGGNFRDIMSEFGFGANETGIDRNIKRGTLSQAQARKHYRQVIALVNQKRALDKRIDKLRKEADKIHDIIAR